MAADLALLVILAVVAFDVGGVGAVGLVGAARVAPAALLGPAVVPLSDRLPRQHVLALSHGFAVLTSLAMAWAAANNSLSALLAATAAASVAGSLFKAVLRATITQVVATPHEFVTANSAYAAIEGVGTVTGPLVGGALLALLDPSAALTALAVVYVMGGATAAFVHTTYQVPARLSTRSRWQGVRVARQLTRPGLRWLVAAFMGQCVMRGLLTVFVAALCLGSGGGGDRRVAALFATLGLGGLVGAWLCSHSAGRGTAARRAIAGVALWGAPVGLLGIWPHPEFAWITMAFVGLGNALEDVYGLSVFDRVLPDHLAARAYALFWSVAAGMVTLGSLLGPVLVSSINLGPAMLVSGGALVVFCALVVPGMRSLDATVDARPQGLTLIRSAPELSALPDMAAERLARGMQLREFAGGEVLLREGDRADGFGIVEEGTLLVVQQGRQVRELVHGDSFGEVGLLLDRPRSASVAANGPATVLWLDAATFVAAVTGHRDAAAAAMAVAQEHLRADDERRSIG